MTTEAANRSWYRCERHKVLFQAMGPAEARFATGRSVDHCGSNKTWWIADDDDDDGRVDYWKGRAYRMER